MWNKKMIINNRTDLDTCTALTYVEKLISENDIWDELNNMKVGEWHAVLYESGIGIVYTRNKSSITIDIEDKGINT